MKVVLAASGSRGDVQPMTVIAALLQQRGHQVSLFTPSNMPLEFPPGVEHVPAGMDALGLIQQNGKDTHSPLGFVRLAKRVAGEEVDRQFRALLPMVEGADVMLGGGTLFAGPSLSEKTGVPYVSVAYISTLLESPFHPPLLMPFTGTPPWLNRILWRLSNLFADASLGPLLNAQREKLGLPKASRLFTHIRGVHGCLLAVDPELAPPPPDLASFLRVTGPWTRDVPKPLPADVDAFINAGPAPVYVGFGSMGDHDPAATTRLIVDAATQAGVRVLISQGWAGLGSQALPPHVLMVGDVSHTALFPRMAGLVHHGGAGTTSAGLRAGHPQLVVPHIADQFFIGTQLEKLGIGPPKLARRSLTVEKLAGGLRQLTQDKGMQERAAAMATSLQGRNGVLDAVTWLERRGWEQTQLARR